MRVLIASHYTSEALGGEAAIPLRLFDRLKARGVDTWLVAHDSDAEELRRRFSDYADRLILTSSLPGMSPIFRWGEKLPDGPRSLAWGVTQVERQIAMVGHVRRLVDELSIDVVHQPIGIAPGVPSPFTNLGAPLVVGPLNGGLSMPVNLRSREARLALWVQKARRPVGLAAHHVLRGKLKADVILVANERTRGLLPKSCVSRSEWMPESAVVLRDWAPKDYTTRSDGPTRFVYLGRLVPLKSPDLLLEAFALATRHLYCHLTIVGDGPQRELLEHKVVQLGLRGSVMFTGWVTKSEASRLLRDSDVFVHPSLREAGGTAVLEAMASMLPCIVADWGGPAEYVDDATGVRVPVSSRESLVQGLAAAMTRLGDDRRLREEMGATARVRIAQHYDWDVLTARLIDIYSRLCAAWIKRDHER